LSKLNESDADAFFLAGDLGTYDGGPADSVVPVAREEIVDERPAPPTAAQLERREKLKRLVTTVVATLGAGSLLVFSFRFASTNHDEPEPTVSSRSVEARIAPEVAPAHAAGVGAIHVVDVAQEAAPPPPPRAVANTETTVPVVNTEAPATVKRATVRPVQQEALQGRRTARVVRETPVSGAVRRTTLSATSSFGHETHSPPTANFPD
jgi:hypothetical protein